MGGVAAGGVVPWGGVRWPSDYRSISNCVPLCVGGWWEREGLGALWAQLSGCCCLWCSVKLRETGTNPLLLPPRMTRLRTVIWTR